MKGISTEAKILNDFLDALKNNVGMAKREMILDGMLGHTNLRTTQDYAKILDLKVSEDMQALKNKLEGKAAESFKPTKD